VTARLPTVPTPERDPASDDGEFTVRDGDRFKALEDVQVNLAVIRKAPMSAASHPGVIPEGMVLVTHDLGSGATVAVAHPEDYFEAEVSLLPEDVRSAASYARYAVWIPVVELAQSFERLASQVPPPGNRTPDRSG
jgi:hypothetical protein